MRRTQRIWRGLQLLLAILLSAQVVSGQTPAVDADTARLRAEAERRLGRPISQAEALQWLRQSGMTRSELRAQLQQLGFDPALADAYFDMAGTAGLAAQSDEFLLGLEGAGVTRRLGQPESLRRDMSDPFLQEAYLLRLLATQVMPFVPDTIFGRDLFRRSTTQFQADALGPVDASYRVAAGDELVLLLTGDVELAYQLEVTREGFVVVPDAGQVPVSGATLRELESRLRGRLARVYSGVAGGTTHVQVSLGRLRSNLVYIVGEAERPGAYQVAGGASVFNALYQARGPNENGSFRNIEVRRGDRVIARVDLYDYLVSGDPRGDVRLEHGDIVFVPVAGPRVWLKGAVRREALYELRDGDDLASLVGYAGGFQARAHVQRIQIDRILPPGQRSPGRDRVLQDIDLVSFLRRQEPQRVGLQDGDIVQVFTVSDRRRHRVTLSGDVRRPGVYEWLPGMTLGQLLSRADGLEESAYTARAHIFRLIEEDGRRRLIRTELSNPEVVQTLPLIDLDSIVVFSREQLANPRHVTIDGFVKNPGRYELAEGMSLRDLVLAAGGFVDGAHTPEAEVARSADHRTRTARMAEVIRVPLEALGYGGPASDERARQPDLPDWTPGGDEFELQHGDRVFVRRSPGYFASQTVAVSGEVLFPGSYVLESRQETLVDVLRRAGGLAPEARAEGLQLMRAGTLVSTDLRAALQNPGSRFNVVLLPGDSLHIPALDPTVLVTGAVAFESRVLFKPGERLDYYVQRAGGYTDIADRKRVAVIYQDGGRAVVQRTALVRRTPEIGPGSAIYVPEKPPRELQGINWMAVISATSAVLGATATLLIALR
jgi:polysaccharide biosynthesis/export protein